MTHKSSQQLTTASTDGPQPSQARAENRTFTRSASSIQVDQAHPSSAVRHSTTSSSYRTLRCRTVNQATGLLAEERVLAESGMGKATTQLCTALWRLWKC